MKIFKKSTVAVSVVIISFIILIILGLMGNPYSTVTGIVAFCAAVATIVGLSLLKKE